MHICAATIDDLQNLPAIEDSGDYLYRSVPDRAWIDAMPSPTIDSFRRFLDLRTLWVARLDDNLAGFLAAVPDKGWLFIAQLSVAASAQRKGVGSALLRHASWAAGALGLQALGLITYYDLPWQGPFYEKHGFQVQPVPPDLAHQWDADQARGFVHPHRVFMARAL